MLSLAFLIDHAVLHGHEQFLCDIEEKYVHACCLFSCIGNSTTPNCFKVTLISPYMAVDTMPNITVVETQTAQ